MIFIATKTTTSLVDDLDGSPADVTVAYTWGGQAYEIDLTAQHAEQLGDTLAPYMAASRKAGRAAGPSRTRGRSTPADKAPATRTPDGQDSDGHADPTQVRAWAHANKVEVSPRGRISKSVLDEQYAAGHR